MCLSPPVAPSSQDRDLRSQGLAAAYFAIDVFTRQEWRVTPLSGALRPERVAAAQALLGVAPHGAFEHSTEARSLPRRLERRDVNLGFCLTDVDACVRPAGVAPPVAPSAGDMAGTVNVTGQPPPRHVVVFTLRCDGTRPFNSSCFAMDYYAGEMRELSRAAAASGLHLWRHGEHGPVAPLFGEALASMDAVRIDAVWLMHEIANMGAAAADWRQHR